MLKPDQIGVRPCAQASPESVFDYAKALEHVEGDRELLGEIATLFLETHVGQLSALRAAIARGDAQALQNTAHKLKGSIGNFAAAEAFNAAQKLEGLGLSGDLAEAEPVCLALEGALERLKNALACVQETVLS
jgi:HPt (histidine-containing phosphotransfer) domain-containing protein